MVKRLGQEPWLEDSVELDGVGFGLCNEVGARCKLVNTVFGDYSYVGNDSDIINTTIGKFCSIAAHVRINPGNHPVEKAAMHHFTYRSALYGLGEDDESFFDWRRSKPVRLGHDVWVGHGAVILAGVSIGNGAVIAAGAVVSKDVEAFTIVGGVPAKPIRKRFGDDVIEGLERIKWWDWPESLLRERMQHFRQLGAEKFVALYDEGGSSGAD